MAKNYCTFVPSKGNSLFKELRKNFDYPTARDIFLRSINPNFIRDFKDTLSLDAEGVPSFESVINNPYIKQLIGTSKITQGMEKQFPHVEDTRENFGNILESAYQFNTTNPNSENYVAIVDYDDEGKLKVGIRPRTKENEEIFNDQYSTHKLNTKLASIFAPLGVTVDNLSDAEFEAGRLGVTDFNRAKNIATDAASMIRVANNMQGAVALSEEFSHLIVGIFRDEPLMRRAINVLANNEAALKKILGDEYKDTVDFQDGNMELVAEEALGQLLRTQLTEESKVDKDLPSPSLFRRLWNWLVRQFKRFSADDVYKAIDDARALLGPLAKDVLNGTRKITAEDVRRSYREAQFNALQEHIDRNIKILKEAAAVETKKAKIGKESNKIVQEAMVAQLQISASEDADTAEGILNYASYALSELRGLETSFQSLESMTPEQKFGFLRNVRMHIQSFGGFINSVTDALIEDKDVADDMKMFTSTYNVNGEEMSLEDIIKELNILHKGLERRYINTALPAFIEFLKPFLGEDIVIPFGKRKGEVISVESLMQEARSDISFMDRWLDSMGNSADTLLQLFDKVVKRANTEVELKTIDDFNHKALVFRDKCEAAGITDFEWAFEKDREGNKTGNYVGEVNYGQFEKDLDAMYKELDEKYGKNPKGEALKNKIAEKKAWLAENATTVFGTPHPNPIKYRNKDYDRLTDTQKKLLEEFLNLKEQYDRKYPKDRVNRMKAIQVRKVGGQRLWSSLSNPSTILSNVKGAVASSIFEQSDDDALFGERTKRGLTDFEGKEFMVLPVLYTNKLSDPNELSTDLIGSLMQYMYAANQYEGLDKIVDPIEVGVTLVSDPSVRPVRETRGDTPVVEKINAVGNKVTNKLNKGTSNIVQKLLDWRDSQIYHRYLKDEGTFDLFGKKANVNKLVGLLLKGSSLAQLGLNWLANIANVATGVCMQNIEAVAGQHFSVKELARADAIYAKQLIPVLAELSKRNKTNKMSLVFQLFNVKQNFGSKVKDIQKKSLLQRIFGTHVAFIGQDAGDHWLYGRTAIAMLLRKQVLLDGKKMSLWGALQVQGIEGHPDIKELNYKNIKELDGSPLDVDKIKRAIMDVNQGCFGQYNDEDSNAANRVAMGRLLQQYRKWMKIQYTRRFQKGQTNLMTDTWQEGYYITTGRFIRDLIRGGFQLGAQLDKLTDDEKYNLKRAVTELVQFFAIWALANLIEWPDDKKRPWALKLAEYSAKRLAHETGGLAPSPVMLQELFKTVKSPIPSATTIQNTINLVCSSVDPSDWTDEIQSGPYKGMSTWQKNFVKAPLPIVPQVRQIDKFIGDLDNSINYYARPAAY